MLWTNILLGFIIFLVVLLLGGINGIINEIKCIRHIMGNNKMLAELSKAFDKGKKVDKVKIN